MKIVIPNYRAPSRNKTITSHWRNYQRYRNEISEFVCCYLPEKKIITPARVIIEAHYKNRSIDVSNIDDKLVIDGLMAAGVLPDDNFKHNPEVIKRVFNKSEDNKLVITVTKIN